MSLFFPSQSDPRREALRNMVDVDFDGDAYAAILALADMFGVALYTQGRDDFESDLSRELTDEEWSRIAPRLSDFPEWLSNSGGAESISAWRDQLLEGAGISFDDEEDL